MRTRIATAIATTVLVSLAVVITAPASAKTVKACTKEWQADKAAMQGRRQDREGLCGGVQNRRRCAGSRRTGGQVGQRGQRRQVLGERL